MNPIKEQIELLVKLVPDAKTVGVIYNSSEDNSNSPGQDRQGKHRKIWDLIMRK